MPRAVDVCVVTVSSGVFHVGGVDRDTTSLFFRSVVDFIETLCSGETLSSKSRADCCSKSGFTVVNVTDGADVAMRLTSVKMFFCHYSISILVRAQIGSRTRDLFLTKEVLYH